MRNPELLALAATFSAIVREGGIRGAARAMGVSKATVSRQLQVLEDALELRLVERSTRRLRVTDEGLALLATVENVRTVWNDGLFQLTSTREKPAGRLRVTAPELMMSGVVAPAVAVLLRRHPAIDVELVASDRMIDLVEQGIDVALRVGPAPDSAMRRAHLAVTRECLVGTPALVEQLDTTDPRRMPWVGHSALPVGTERELVSAEGRTLRLTPRLVARSGSSWTFFTLVTSGVGVGLMPRTFVEDRLARGHLVALPWFGRTVGIDAVFPGGRLAPPRVRRFIDVVREQLASPSDDRGGRTPRDSRRAKTSPSKQHDPD